MNISSIQPDGPTIVVEHQATGETPVHVTPEGIRPADPGAAGEDRKVLTYGDWLRNSTTDEQLAKWLASLEDRARRLGISINSPPFDVLVEAWLAWLRQEAE